MNGRGWTWIRAPSTKISRLPTARPNALRRKVLRSRLPIVRVRPGIVRSHPAGVPQIPPAHARTWRRPQRARPTQPILQLDARFPSSIPSYQIVYGLNSVFYLKLRNAPLRAVGPKAHFPPDDRATSSFPVESAF